MAVQARGDRIAVLLERHYIREFFRLFSLTGVGLALIMGMLDAIKKAGELVKYDPSATDLLYYAALGFPRYFLYLMPMAALLCSLYTIGHASRTGEIVAVMAAGGRVKRLLAPFILAGAALSLLGFALGEFVVPACSAKAREVQDSITREDSRAYLSRDGVIWLRAGDGSLVKIDFYLEDEDSFRGMSVFRTGQGGLYEIMRAEEAGYLPEENTWALHDVSIYNTGSGEITRRDDFMYPALGSPSALKKEARKPYELGLFELRRYLGRLEEAGFRNQKLAVEMQSKISYPLMSMFMVVLGISIASRRTLGGLVATALGLLIALIYWFAYTVLLSMGYTGILHPIAAAWLMPTAFGGLAAHLFRNIPE